MPVEVLLIEDNAEDIDSQTRMLKRAGFRVTAARSGEEGLALLRAMVRPPDLIVSDLHLGGMNGYEVARTVQADQKYEAVPLVAISARDMRSARDNAEHAGFRKFIQKPISDDPDELVEELIEVLAPEQQAHTRYQLLKTRVSHVEVTAERAVRGVIQVGSAVKKLEARTGEIELFLRRVVDGVRGYYRIAQAEAVAARTERRFNGQAYQQLQARLEKDEQARTLAIGHEGTRAELEAVRVTTEQRRLKVETRIFWAVVALTGTIIVMWGRWS